MYIIVPSVLFSSGFISVVHCIPNFLFLLLCDVLLCEYTTIGSVIGLRTLELFRFSLLTLELCYNYKI